MPWSRIPNHYLSQGHGRQHVGTVDDGEDDDDDQRNAEVIILCRRGLIGPWLPR